MASTKPGAIQRFHLHAPFIPELSRASIKNSPENAPLFQQLAKLSASALHRIKDLGMLTGDFLAVLPNNDDPLPDRYEIIREAIVAEMKSQALVPTQNGGFAPGSRLYQSRAPMKTLFSDADLAFITNREDRVTWAIGATQKNQNQDRFLNSLGIPAWDSWDLLEFLQSAIGAYSWDDERERKTLDWLGSKSPEWHQTLYSVLYKFCEEEDSYSDFEDIKIVRLTDGSYSIPQEAYFHTGTINQIDDLPRVDEKVFTAGSKKTQQAEARNFLSKVGVKTPGEREEIETLLKSRYGLESEAPSDETYLSDLRRIMIFLESHQNCRDLLTNAFIFKLDSPEFDWGTAEAAYLDTPFLETGLNVFYETMAKDTRKWPLSSWYTAQQIDIGSLLNLCEIAGVEKNFSRLYVQTSCKGNEKYSWLTAAPGERFTSPIDRDFALTSCAHKMLTTNTVEGSQLVWMALCRAGNSVLHALFQKTERGGPHSAPSQLICWLRDLAWIPQKDGRFVKPSAAIAKELPRGFPVDSGYKWLELVNFGADDKKQLEEDAVRASHRAKLGFESDEEFQDGLQFSKLPKTERARILAEVERNRLEPFELPERPVTNPELRHKRVAQEAANAAEKSSERRQRVVQLGVAEAKAQAKAYLTDQYTNANGQMICQACMTELPFMLPTGTYYFEAVEIVAESPKRYREAYLALCPNHAAAYLHANDQKTGMHELITKATENKIEIVLGGNSTTLYFTETHLTDAQAALG
jgi:hypothetical protein